MLGKLADYFLKKEWTEEDVEKYVGEYMGAYLSHSSEKLLREKAASGGTTSALLIHGIEQGYFEGVVICNTVLISGKVRTKFVVATSAEQILAAQGSKYVETNFLREVLPLLRQFNGRVAIVGLPCDISAIKHRCKKENGLSEKVVFTVALVCGHNSRTPLIDHVTNKIEKEAGKKLSNYRFRVGHWRGHIEAEFQDGSIVRKPSKYFNDYQNLFFFSERKCMACHDHYGYSADLTVGDVWLFRLKDDPIKNTAIITRSALSQDVCNSANAYRKIAMTEIGIKDVMDGQSRIGPSHYNVSARYKAGKLIRFKLKDKFNQPVSWHAYINALISLVNMRLSETKLGRTLIFHTPRPILKVYLIAKKGLESFR